MIKRKLKPPSARRVNDDRIGMTELSKEVSKRTGFTTTDIKEVIRVSIEVIIEGLLKRRATDLPKIGVIFPRLRPARQGVDFSKGRKNPGRMTVKARYVAAFKPGVFVKKELLKFPPTKEEIDEIYED